MKKVKYISPTPCHFSYDGKDYSFHNGETYEVPENVGFVKTLLAQNKMIEVEYLPEPVKAKRLTQDSQNSKN